MAIKQLPENCSLLYSDLLQKMQAFDLVSMASGAFISKMVGNSTHWYYQTKQVEGNRKQLWLGKESPELLTRIAGAREAKASASDAMAERKRLVGMLSAGGATMEKGRPGKIIERMADAGVFRGGGVLVGSFAFGCYGNMLGVAFDSALRRTQDMDFSMNREIDVGVARNLHDDLREAEPTFSIPQQINPALKPFEIVAADGFKVELLTACQSPSERAPILIERLGVHAMPLVYMDYLLEHSQPAVVLYGAGVLVAVPDPARYALHKLAVSQLRPSGVKTKADKDIQQAGAILEVLLTDNPGLVMLAADAINARSDLMANEVLNGAKRLAGELRDSVTSWVQKKEWDTSLGTVKATAPLRNWVVQMTQADKLACKLHPTDIRQQNAARRTEALRLGVPANEYEQLRHEQLLLPGQSRSSGGKGKSTRS